MHSTVPCVSPYRSRFVLSSPACREKRFLNWRPEGLGIFSDSGFVRNLFRRLPNLHGHLLGAHRNLETDGASLTRHLKRVGHLHRVGTEAFELCRWKKIPEIAKPHERHLGRGISRSPCYVRLFDQRQHFVRTPKSKWVIAKLWLGAVPLDTPLSQTQGVKASTASGV